MTDWKAVEDRQRAEADDRQGMPLLVSDVRKSARLLRDRGMDRGEVCRIFLAGTRPGSLRTNEVIDLLNEEWPIPQP